MYSGEPWKDANEKIFLFPKFRGPLLVHSVHCVKPLQCPVEIVAQGTGANADTLATTIALS